MGKRLIQGDDFKEMVIAAEHIMRINVDKVNDLNVFPVPDGDTGSNMHRTLVAGREALVASNEPSLGEAAGLFADGLLMGARGNSGVILSQLFRGFSEEVLSLPSMNARQLAEALQAGVNAAYDTVVNPMEGTILTVAREAAKHALKVAKKNEDVIEVMIAVRDKAQETLSKTPQMLDVLKEVGVVDSGGQGLVIVYEGFVRALTGEEVHENTTFELTAYDSKASDIKVQAQIDAEAIEHFYDMEFFIELTNHEKQESAVKSLRKSLKKLGDSILVIPNQEFVKVHVHSKSPGEVLTSSLKLGELRNIHVENMREQHKKYISEGQAIEEEPLTYSIISVAAGEGIAEVFRSIGVDRVVSGGQTMNPSIEDLLQAIRSAPGEHCIILPNNSNIKLAAEQAKQLADKTVGIIPTTTIQQGIAAALAFQSHVNLAQNIEAMTEAARRVKSGQVTFATRDTKLNGLKIRKGELLGISENEIVASSSELLNVCQEVLRHLIDHDDEVLTVFTGTDADPKQTQSLVEQMEQQYPDIDIEVLDGKQPVYSYLFSVE